jgi:Tol biopolymer transport system component
MLRARSSAPPSQVRLRVALGAVVVLGAIAAGSVGATASVRSTSELPANGRIVYSHFRDIPSEWDIRSIGATGDGVARLAIGPGLETEPQVSPDGTKIAYFNDRDLVVMNIDGSDQHRLTPAGSTDFRTQIRWSPDGTTLAYLNLSPADDYQLYTIPALGGEPQRVSVGLTTVHTRNGFAWSPDSRSLAFGARDPSTDRDVLYIAAADGSALDPFDLHLQGGGICSGDCWAGEDAVDWSPDGSTIAYSLDDDIWTVHPDGSGATQLLADDRDFGRPQWSPTGEQLLYIADDLDSPGRLGVVGADGQNDHLIPDAWVWSASWSPDGTAIVFEGANSEIYTVPAAGGTPTRLTFDKKSDDWPDWAAGCSITGTPGADVLEGTPEPDYICGRAGDDVITGLGGDDVLLGGAGADTVLGGAGNDLVTGERGADQLRGGAGDDTVNGRDGLGERLMAGPGDDRCRRDAGDVLVGCEAIDRDL